jgi:nitric oxide reductase subunit C
MAKVLVFLLLFTSFIGYSAFVYTDGTAEKSTPPNMQQAMSGKKIFQEYNCISCHQIYGLGGYLGPDLTIAFSDRKRGEAYMRALMQSGSKRMPDFQLTEKQIDDLIAYFKYVDHTAKQQ